MRQRRSDIVGGSAPVFSALAGLLLTGALPGCGGGPPTTPPTPPPPVTRTVYSASYTMAAAPFGAAVLSSTDVHTPAAGDVDVILDWTFATSDLDLFVTGAACDEASLLDNRCPLLGSDRGPAKPRRVRFALRTPDTVRVWIVSFANVMESGVLNVLLTS